MTAAIPAADRNSTRVGTSRRTVRNTGGDRTHDRGADRRGGVVRQRCGDPRRRRYDRDGMTVAGCEVEVNRRSRRSAGCSPRRRTRRVTSRRRSHGRSRPSPAGCRARPRGAVPARWRRFHRGQLDRELVHRQHVLVAPRLVGAHRLVVGAAAGEAVDDRRAAGLCVRNVSEMPCAVMKSLLYPGVADQAQPRAVRLAEEVRHRRPDDMHELHVRALACAPWNSGARSNIWSQWPSTSDLLASSCRVWPARRPW